MWWKHITKKLNIVSVIALTEFQSSKWYIITSVWWKHITKKLNIVSVIALTEFQSSKWYIITSVWWKHITKKLNIVSVIALTEFQSSKRYIITSMWCELRFLWGVFLIQIKWWRLQHVFKRRYVDVLFKNGKDLFYSNQEYIL